jgi:hypothetical protein
VIKLVFSEPVLTDLSSDINDTFFITTSPISPNEQLSITFQDTVNAVFVTRLIKGFVSMVYNETGLIMITNFDIQVGNLVFETLNCVLGTLLYSTPRTLVYSFTQTSSDIYVRYISGMSDNGVLLIPSDRFIQVVDQMPPVLVSITIPRIDQMILEFTEPVTNVAIQFNRPITNLSINSNQVLATIQNTDTGPFSTASISATDFSGNSLVTSRVPVDEVNPLLLGITSDWNQIVIRMSEPVIIDGDRTSFVYIDKNNNLIYDKLVSDPEFPLLEHDNYRLITALISDFRIDYNHTISPTMFIASDTFHDLAGNPNDMTHNATIVVIKNSHPFIQNCSTVDQDRNGQVDQVLVVFNEPVIEVSERFQLNNSDVILTKLDSTTYTINVSNISTDAIFTLVYNASTALSLPRTIDLYLNYMNTTLLQCIDNAPPIMLSAIAQADTDQMIVSYSESLTNISFVYESSRNQSIQSFIINQSTVICSTDTVFQITDSATLFDYITKLNVTITAAIPREASSSDNRSIGIGIGLSIVACIILTYLVFKKCKNKK